MMELSWLLLLLLVMIILLIIYFWMIHPLNSRKDRMLEFTAFRFAHRGLHGTLHLENTMSAFLKAKEEGYGVELDVRLTKDFQVVVFHDDTLVRLAGVDYRVSEMTYEELAAVPLTGTDDRIPLFSEVLAVLSDTPILVEIKPEIESDELCKRTAELLDTYSGLYAVQSFNPFVLSWFRKNRPDILRGQLAQKRYGMYLPVFTKFILSNMLSNSITRPDFLSYRISDTDQLSFRICRKIYHPVMFGWTVRTETEWKFAEQIFDTIIFEKIRPGKK